MSAKRIAQLAFGVLLIAFAVYGWRFIQRTAVVLPDGERIWALFDDAMISMQFAKNFAHGHGLVWNPGGERVEGFSNPLWVLLMAGIHLFPIALTQTSLYVKLMSLGFLLLNLYAVKKLAEEISDSVLVPVLAVFLTAFYFPLNNWSLQGMEVGLQALLLNAALWLGLRARRLRRFSGWPYALLALAVVLRMDSAAPALAAIAALAWIDEDRRKLHVQWGLAAVFGTLAALTMWRVLYYGDWLPNTYYLKLGGVSTVLRVSLGLRLFWDFVWNSNWVLFALPLALPALDRRQRLWPLYAAFAAQAAYSIYVGGDSWEHTGGANRFLAAVMPIFFVLLAHTLGLLMEQALRAAKFKLGWARSAAGGFVALFAAVSLLSLNALQVQNPMAKWTLRDKPVFTESVERYAQMGLALRAVTEPQATIAVVTAGNIPYFAERTAIDILGKNDRVIAHGPARINSSLFEPGNYRPGHNKWDYAYSFGVLHPDVIAQIWEDTDEEAESYLADYEMHLIDGIPYYFRIGSEYVRWEELE
jgi:hypothetical protein